MSAQERAFLEAQSVKVRQLLEGLPVDEQIERLGLEGRLAEIEEQLAALNVATPAVSEVELTFRGDPVVGSQAIEATFAARALAAFEQAVATVAAVMRLGSISDTGPIPNRGEHRLFVTGCAVGSFGFRLEEIPEDDVDRTEPTTVSVAVQQTKAILEGCAADDDKLADALSETGPRVLNPIRDFLSVMKTARATCGLAVNGSRFRFENLEEVSIALERASLDVVESRNEFSGILRGVLPDTRKFDFKLDSGDVLSGKIDRTLDNPDELLGLIGRRCRARLLIREVGRVRIVRRYSLLTLEPTPEARAP